MSKLIETSAVTARSSSFELAFTQLRPEMDALSDDELASVNCDVPAAVTRVLGALPQIQALRQAAAQLPDFDATVFDRLQVYTGALAHAHTLCAIADRRSGSLRTLGAEGSHLRQMLCMDARALIGRGLIYARALDRLKGTRGYGNVAFDLLTLSELMHSRWSEIEGKTAVSHADLARAHEIAEALMRELGGRRRESKAAAEASKARQRAFTLFVRAYDQTRRAVCFLRWEHGDGDRIAPSLFAGRSNGRGKRGAGEEVTPRVQFEGSGSD